MHRLLPCLPFLVVALLACDDAGAPATDSTPETTGCGMTLPGVGAWTVAQYDDGHLVDANREFALRTAADGRLSWHRLDGAGSGPVDLGTPFAQEQTVHLYDRDHVLVRGSTGNSNQRARLIRLSNNRIEHEIEYRFEGRGEWVIIGNTLRDGVPNPRLRSLRSGKSFGLPCGLCSMVSVDGFGRAWIGDELTDDLLIEVELSTGRATLHPGLYGYRAQQAGAGIRASGSEGWLVFGAAKAPVTACQAHESVVASTGQIACPREQALDIFERDGTIIRSVPGVDFRSPIEFGAGFLVQTAGRREFAWVPFEGPVVRFQGFRVARTARVVIFLDFESARTKILHADGRVVTLDDTVMAVPRVSADSRFALVRRETDFAVIDLDSGAVTLEVPAGSAWTRFVGSVLLIDGAPLGETPPSNISTLLFPDRRCPVMLYEQCDGADCVLNIQQFEEPGVSDLLMNQDG